MKLQKERNQRKLSRIAEDDPKVSIMRLKDNRLTLFFKEPIRYMLVLKDNGKWQILDTQ